jgi:CheY-like chemotaxis protein
VKQILLNLLSNAAKFTHQGRILVSASRWKPDSIQDITNFGTAELLAVKVEDSGIGIPGEKLDAIFGEFQQADSSTTRKYGGTGLGLSISQKLATLLGGALFVSSEEEKGSTFTLVLPIRYEEDAPVSHQSLHEFPMKKVVDSQGPVILAIDDDPNTIYLLQENLGEAGYQVMAALNADEGLELARKHLPYAITLDIKMPTKDGWQVLHELKVDDLTKDIPVILLTVIDKKALGYRLGADDYLVKPLDEEAVLAALNRIAQSRKGAAPKRILVVDDDPDVIDLVRQLLAGTGYELENAIDGLDALEIVVKNKPDIILLDLLMPGLDGFGFIEQLRQRPDFDQVPIVVITAKTLSNDEREYLQKSVINVIQKQGLERASLINELETALSEASE